MQRHQFLCNFGVQTGDVAWYLSGGAPAPVGAYRAKGAASYAASLVNLANPGTNDLTEGNGAVTWDATNGWQFVTAASKYFNTGLIPNTNQSWSAFIQFSGASTTGRVFGARNATGREFLIAPVSAVPAGVLYANGARLGILPTAAAANLGMAGNTAYRNGSAEATPLPAWTAGTSVYAIFVGCVNDTNTPSAFTTANILAVVIYNSTLTGPQAAAVAAAMASL